MNQIILKNSNVTGHTPAPSSLAPGEVAINTADGNLYAKKDDGTVVCLNPTVNPYYNYYSGPDANLNQGNWISGLRSDNPGNQYFSGIFFGTPTVTDTSVPYAIGQGYKGPFGYSLTQATTKSATMSSQNENPNNGDRFSGSLSLSPRLSYSYTHFDVNNNLLATSAFGINEGSLSITVSQGQYPNTVTADLSITPGGGATLTNTGDVAWTADSILTQGYADTRYLTQYADGEVKISSGTSVALTSPACSLTLAGDNVCVNQSYSLSMPENTVLTLVYADGRYAPRTSGFTGSFTTSDGQTVTVENGVIVSVQ